MKKLIIIAVIIIIALLIFTRNYNWETPNKPDESEGATRIVDVSENSGPLQCIAFEQIHEITKDNQIVQKAICYRWEDK